MYLKETSTHINSKDDMGQDSCDMLSHLAQNEGFATKGNRLETVSLSPSFTRKGTTGKHFQDRAHEYVYLPDLAVTIVDTPEFQRLRTVKQLGSVCRLYPGATHTRFEHSIGVAHLASEMLRHLSFFQRSLNITKADMLTVTIAGLCHDLGHGPFSHLFESLVNRVRSRNGQKAVWRHEHMSIAMLRRILSRIDLSQYGLNEDDARFIELCITGLHPSSPWPQDVGRSEEKRFLVDIVSNKRSGLDVDKLDYFLRDSLACYGRAALDVNIPRLLSACKVLRFEGQYQICFEEKMALNLREIFSLRAKLHKNAYKHRVTFAIDQMLSDVLLEVEPYFFVSGEGGMRRRLSECVEDPEAFCKLGDWIYDAIDASDKPEFRRAQGIIRRIKERDLYTVVGIETFKNYQCCPMVEDVREEILRHCQDHSPLRATEISVSLIVGFMSITYGSTDSKSRPDDPLNHIAFFKPANEAAGAFHLPMEHSSPLFSPCTHGERSVIVMVRDRILFEVALAAFTAWKDKNASILTVAIPTFNDRREEGMNNPMQLPRSQSERVRSEACDGPADVHDNLPTLISTSDFGDASFGKRLSTDRGRVAAPCGGTSDCRLNEVDKDQANSSGKGQRFRKRRRL